LAYSPTELLTVYLDAQNQRRKVGRLAFKDRHILFEFDASYGNDILTLVHVGRRVHTERSVCK